MCKQGDEQIKVGEKIQTDQYSSERHLMPHVVFAKKKRRSLFSKKVGSFALTLCFLFLFSLATPQKTLFFSPWLNIISRLVICYMEQNRIYSTKNL